MVDESVVLTEGEWTHRFISANGCRFHVAETGTGPLVLFLHGFPEFWGAWQHQLRAVAEAGFRAVAMDLRGYGATDKPPRGYDGFTMAGDVVGVIRALGERSATLVGSGFGGMLAWTTASFHGPIVDRLVVLGAAHPLRLNAAILAAPRDHLLGGRPVLKFQVPRYEHVLTRDDAALVGGYLRQWSGPVWPATGDFAAYERQCRQAFQITQASFCALEAFRWEMRSLARLHGHRFRRQLRAPIERPTLQLHGAADPVVLPRSAQGSGRYVAAEYEWRLLDGIGHFPHREAADIVSGEIIRWAKA